jgi:uncharacterized membrane protein YgaE (UPF0421/DUF939 family)
MRLAVLEGVGSRTRRAIANAVGRVRAGGWAALQAAVAAGIGWVLASQVLRHQTAFFAPVAAIIVFGTTRGQHITRAVELTLGVAVGAALAGALGPLVPIPALRITVVVALIIVLAQAAGMSPLFVAQAAVSGIFVVTLPGQGFSQRLIDALIGGGVALLIGHALFPIQPLALLENRALPLFERLASTLEDLAAALAAGDRARAVRALDRARALDSAVRSLYEALDVGYEVTRYALVRRGDRPSLEPWADALTQIDYAVRNTRVLARAAMALLRTGRPAPPEITNAVRDLAAAVRGLRGQLPVPGREATQPERQEAARQAALEAADKALGVFDRQRELALAMVVGQIRSTALDLLRASGMEATAALDALEEVTGPIVPTPDADGADRRRTSGPDAPPS